MKKKIAIITARGGSKRIPGKNVKLFLGKPIIEYSIEAALKSGVFDEVMVSTDDIGIKQIAEKAGAKVPFMRSEETSNDYATTADVLYEVLNEYKQMGESFDYACCIYPTAPFVTAEKLRNGMKMLEEAEADTVLPIVAFSFPPQRGVKISEQYVKLVQPEYQNVRSQDIENIYHDCGQFYCFDVKRFMNCKNVIGEKTLPYVMDELEVQDIDTNTDWKLAELKYQLMIEKN